MARNNTIVCIHGINTRPPDPFALETAWEDAIIESSGVKIPRDRIHFVYWGDLATASEKKHFIAGSSASKAAMLKFQEDVIVEAVQSGRNAVPKNMKKNWTACVSTRKDALSLYDLLDAPVKKALRDLAHDAYLYFYDKGFAEAVREKLKGVLGLNQKSNILLMGHSLGSVISYDVLRTTEDSIRINDFITFGSPLGLGFVQTKLQEKQHRHFPSNISGDWTNISDPIDFVATDHELADNFKRGGKKAVVDLSVKNTQVDKDGNRDSHDALGYIQAKEFGNVLKGML